VANYYYHHIGTAKLFAISVYGILGGRMIPFVIIRKILASIAPLALFYLLKKVARNQHLPKKKSHQSDFDSSKIVEGEIVEEKK